jgi:hypothetical protein
LFSTLKKDITTMPALHKDSCAALRYNLTSLFSRHLGHIEMPKLTHAEAFELLVKKEHQQILIDAAEVADVHLNDDYSIAFDLAGPIDGTRNTDTRVRLRAVNGQKPPLAPRVPAWNANASAAVPVLTWVAKRQELGRLYGLAMHVLNELLDRCENGRTIRYVWPAIGQLVTNCNGWSPEGQDRLNRDAHKITEYSRPKTMPGFTMAFRRAMGETNGLITASAMIDHMPAPDASYGVLLDVGSSSFMWDGVLLQRL